MDDVDEFIFKNIDLPLSQDYTLTICDIFSEDFHFPYDDRWTALPFPEIKDSPPALKIQNNFNGRNFAFVQESNAKDKSVLNRPVAHILNTMFCYPRLNLEVDVFMSEYGSAGLLFHHYNDFDYKTFDIVFMKENISYFQIRHFEKGRVKVLAKKSNSNYLQLKQWARVYLTLNNTYVQIAMQTENITIIKLIFSISIGVSDINKTRMGIQSSGSAFAGFARFQIIPHEMPIIKQPGKARPEDECYIITYDMKTKYCKSKNGENVPRIIECEKDFCHLCCMSVYPEPMNRNKLYLCEKTCRKKEFAAMKEYYVKKGPSSQIPIKPN